MVAPDDEATSGAGQVYKQEYDTPIGSIAFERTQELHKETACFTPGQNQAD